MHGMTLQAQRTPTNALGFLVVHSGKRTSSAEGCGRRGTPRREHHQGPETTSEKGCGFNGAGVLSGHLLLSNCSMTSLRRGEPTFGARAFTPNFLASCSTVAPPYSVCSTIGIPGATFLSSWA